MAWPRRLAWAAAILTGLVLVAGGGFAVLAPTRYSLLNLLFALVVAPLSAGLGLVITRRTDGNPVGPLLAFVGLTVAITATREIAWQMLDDRQTMATQLDWLVAALEEGAWWVLVAVALVLLHFPDGKLPSPRWRWVPAAMVGALLVNQVFGALDPAPFRPPLADLDRPWGPPPLWLEVLAAVAFVVMMGLVIASAFSLFVRFRRSDPLRRRQLKWLAVGGFGVAAYPLLCLVEILLWGRPTWVSVGVGLLGLAGIPVTTAIAMLRHDLYDVDRAIAGAVTWGMVSAVLIVVYVGVSSTAGLFLGRDSPVAAAGATALAAVVLSPLKNGVQARVDRHLHPLRRAAHDALDALHRDVSAGTATPEELEPVLRAALRDPGLRVGYQRPGQGGFVDAGGMALSTGKGRTVVLDGKEVGLLVGGTGDASSGLLSEIAERATALVEMVRLRMELADALREVESSRARLLQSGYEERRRLERDLHDGAQQRLVSLGMSIRLAQRHLGDGTVDVDELLDESVAELGTAVAELRQIAHGIRPSSLDDGLPAALARLVRNIPLVVQMEVEVGILPDDVATTAYFVVSEALTNAVKHAEAERISLTIARRDGKVLVRVSDDGRGGALIAPVSAMADRVAALGGSLQVESLAGCGTTVEAALPCAS